MAVISFLMRDGQQIPTSILLNSLVAPFAFGYCTITFCYECFSARRFPWIPFSLQAMFSEKSGRRM